MGWKPQKKKKKKEHSLIMVYRMPSGTLGMHKVRLRV